MTEDLFASEHVGDVVVVTVRGPWTAVACPAFGALTTQLVRRGHERVVLDLQAATTVDASAFGRILELQDLLCPARDGGVRLVGVGPAVLQDLEESHLIEVLPLFPDVRSALDW